MLASSTSQGSGAGLLGVFAGALHGLQLTFGCQVIYVVFLLSESSHYDFNSRLPLPLALVSMW